MSSWRKKLLILVIVALVVCAIVFWGTAAGVLCIFLLIQSFQIMIFTHVASNELAKQFQEDGEHVKGWK